MSRARSATGGRAQPEDRKQRVLLGLGGSHGPLIGDAYGKPLAVMGGYLDRLSASGVPAQHLCIK